MNILIDNTNDVKYKGKKYTINNCGFKQVIKFFNLINDERMKYKVKLGIINRMFFNPILKNEYDTFEIALQYINNSIDTEIETTDDKANNVHEQEIVYDLTIDAELIYAAFYQVYNIDLNKNNIPWHTFRVLMSNLPEGNRFMSVIGVRSSEFISYSGLKDKELENAAKYNFYKKQIAIDKGD